jgi:sialic acid synthase
MATMPIKEEYFNIDLKGINAIKLTKRDLEEEMSETMKNMIYDNPNSFGRTYGEHRNYLELTELEHYEIFKYTKKRN